VKRRSEPARACVIEFLDTGRILVILPRLAAERSARRCREADAERRRIVDGVPLRIAPMPISMLEPFGYPR
jgi:hypothetical protein